MADPRILRRAQGSVVKHPLSGKVEFVGRPELAVEVAAVLDIHDPVTPAYVFDMLYAIPAAERYSMEWFAPQWVLLNLRQFVEPDMLRGSLPFEFYLISRPVHIDNELEGLTLRVPACLAS